MILCMFRLRPTIPSKLWYSGQQFFIEVSPRLGLSYRAARMLTFAELRFLLSDSLTWSLLIDSFRRDKIPFSVFSEVMHAWFGTAALDRLSYLVRQHHGKFWQVGKVADELELVGISADVWLTKVECLHAAMLFTMVYRGRGGVTIDGIDVEEDTAVEIVRLVSRFGVVRVAPYIAHGCALSMVSYGIENDIDPDLLSSIGG